MQGTTHIIGAGLAGLSAATTLAEAGRRVVVYEAGVQAGGRCRSYHDAALDMPIDNGNHLLLSGNHAAIAYLNRIGSAHHFNLTAEPVFDFADAKTGKRWSLRLNKGKFPFWLFNKARRIPGTTIGEYVAALKLLSAKPEQTAMQVLKPTPLYQKLLHPLLLSALNTHPKEASAVLAAEIIRGTLLKGGEACVPLVADGLSSVFIDPALAYLDAHGGQVMLHQRLRGILFTQNRAASLDFGALEAFKLGEGDTIICAVPPWVAAELLPGIAVPNAYRAILNAHFRIAPPPGFPKILGLLNATTEWIFAFPDRISITVSDADRLMQADREALAAELWREVSALTRLARDLPPWQIVKEKRATFAATPEQDARRPASTTPWSNVVLAGDWVQTHLPSTIEGAIRSGVQAAETVLKNAA